MQGLDENVQQTDPGMAFCFLSQFHCFPVNLYGVLS